MGLDLVTAHVTHPRTAALDWDAAHHAIDQMSPDRLAEIAEETSGEPFDTIAWHRAIVHDTFHALHTLLAGNTRDLDLMLVAGHLVWIAGGMSPGDSPSDTFTTIADANLAPEALDAAGFTIEEDQ